jgi:uncharacterized membrane protein
MISNFFIGLIVMGVGVFSFMKPDILANIIPPTFAVDKMNMSSRSFYQVLGLLLFIFSFLIIFRIIPLG